MKQESCDDVLLKVLKSTRLSNSNWLTQSTRASNHNTSSTTTDYPYYEAEDTVSSDYYYSDRCMPTAFDRPKSEERPPAAAFMFCSGGERTRSKGCVVFKFSSLCRISCQILLGLWKPNIDLNYVWVYFGWVDVMGNWANVFCSNMRPIRGKVWYTIFVPPFLTQSSVCCPKRPPMCTYTEDNRKRLQTSWLHK